MPFDYQMPTADITSANAILVMTVANLFPAGVTLQGFSTDQSYSQDELQVTEDRMGVDGNLVAGWIPSIKPVTVILEASSPSYTAMCQLYRAMEKKRGIYTVKLVATIPSIARIYTWTEGVLKSGQPVADGKKILDPTSWKFDFARLLITKA